MAEPFLAQVNLFPYNFAPKGWAFCAGQLLSISQNTAVFSLVGTFYGGNGTTNFALPDLRGRVPNHQGQGPGLADHVIGEAAGSESVTLTPNNLPAHSHTLSASAAAATTNSPSNAMPAEGSGVSFRGPFKVNTYAGSGANTSLSPAGLGGGQGSTGRTCHSRVLGTDGDMVLAGSSRAVFDRPRGSPRGH